MLDKKFIKELQNKALEADGLILNEKDFIHMNIISRGNEDGLIIYGLQKGDLTILIWIEIIDSKANVRQVKRVSW